MNSKQFSDWADALKTYYPREHLFPNDQSMSLWYQMLKDLDYNDAVKALQRWVATERWSPSIADIRGMVNQMSDSTVGDWSSAWDEVTRAINRCGIYRESEALDSMSETTKECVKAIGWKNICNSEEIGVERGHFRTMFEQRNQRIRTTKSIPDWLRSPVETKVLDLAEKRSLLKPDNETNPKKPYPEANGTVV